MKSHNPSFRKSTRTVVLSTGAYAQIRKFTTFWKFPD